MSRQDYSNLVDQQFGRLTVKEISSKAQKDRVRATAICLCECGNQKEVMIRSLVRTDGRGTQSCGCLSKELSAERIETVRPPKSTLKANSRGTRQADGKHHPLFIKWVAMKRRCENPSHKSYPNYGGRGIKVCDRWQDFETFRDDCIILGWQEGLTIDRIDNNGNYEPNNVRFVDLRIQARNRRTNHLITINGQTKPLVEWCEAYNRNLNTVCTRIRRGVDEVTAILKPTPSPYRS